MNALPLDEAHESTLAFNKSLGRRIKQYRHARGLALRTLSKKSGVGYHCLWRWEQGAVTPTLVHLRALCVALRIDLSDLFEGSH